MKKVLIGMIVTGLAFSAVLWAAEGKSEATKPEKVRPTRPAGAQLQRENRPNVPGMGGMQQGFEAMMKKRKEDHLKAVGELEEIKKIAESENATKTVEALQKMIDKKNEEFKKVIDDIEKRQKERTEQIEKRRQEMEARKAADPTKATEKKEETK